MKYACMYAYIYTCVHPNRDLYDFEFDLYMDRAYQGDVLT